MRWPGGCFADEYHWKDGIGPKENRKKMINTNWGGVVEDNSFGTHEYFELCEQLGCDTYVNGNVGSGTVQEMDPEYYGCLFKQFNTYCRDYSGNNHILRVATGPNVDDYHWTKEVMDKVKHHANCISLHYYTIPTGKWEHKGSATDFDLNEYNSTICKAYRMEELISTHLAMMDSINPQRWVKLIVDEWGTWYDVEPGTNPGFLYQQNTMRDAIVAGLTLNIFNKHADRVMMANIAQTVNVLQSVLLTDGEKMIKTPTYYVFKIYKEHQNNTLLGSYITSDNINSKNDGKSFPQLVESASIDENGTIYSTITNTSSKKSSKIKCQIADKKVSEITAEIITGEMHEKNDFDNGDNVKSVEFTSFRKLGDGFVAEIPPCSVVKFVIK